VKEERAGGDDAVRPAFPDAPGAAAATLEVLTQESAARILEVHRRLLGLRRRESWLADADVTVREATLENTYAEIVLEPSSGAACATAADHLLRPLVLALNLGDEDRPAPGEVVEAVSGADMLDAIGPAAPGTVPAHGLAVVR